MLKQTDFSTFEPLLRLRQHVTTRECVFLDRLIDVIRAVPLDQPHCASVIELLAHSFIEYASDLGEVKSAFADLLEQAMAVPQAARDHRLEIQGTPPAAQLEGRIMTYPVWALASKLTTAHRSLCYALGAEVAHALVRREHISESYCNRLRRDIAKVGRLPTNEEAATPQDLARLRVGEAWIDSFKRIDRVVRRMVCKEPPDPESKAPLRTDQLIGLLRHRFTYPNPSSRNAVQHDSCMPPEALREVAHALRCHVDAGSDAAFVQTACVLTGYSVEAMLSVPICRAGEKVKGVALSAAGDRFLLDLDCLFPSRHVPSSTIARLFEPAGNLAPLWCPKFFAQEVARRLGNMPHVSRFGDLVIACGVSARTALLEEDVRKLYASLARCSKSMAPLALSLGLDRLATAFQTWDFSIMPSARAYYARLLAADSLRAAERIFQFLGWLLPEATSDIEAFGSHCVLTPAAVTELFGHLAGKCSELWPGRRGSLDRLLAHHAAYAIFTAALLTFVLGAREAARYELLASELCLGQQQVVLNDKGRKNVLRAAPVPINRIAREQIRLWRAHCAALATRLGRERDHRAMSLRIRLQEIASRAPTRLLVDLEGSDVVALGSAQVWGSLSAHLRVPANVGRHFWHNTLGAHGHSSLDIGRFMRHQALYLDPNDSDCDSIASDAFHRIISTQERVLSALSVTALPGLRKA